MADIAALIADMIRDGVDPDMIGRVAQAMADLSAASNVDDQAERRRASDAARKAAKRAEAKMCVRTSADSADSADNPSPLCPPLSLPQTPTQAPPISPQPVLVGQAAQQRQASDTSRGTRLPLDWQATPEMHSYAMDHGVPPEAIERMDTDFREHWIGKPGAGGRKADWTLTYQTWARREGDKHRARQRDPPRQFNRDPYRSPLD